MSQGTRAPRLIAALWAVSIVIATSALAGVCASARTLLCEGDVRHPVEVRVQPMEAVRRGAVTRFRLTVTSALALRSLEVRLVSAGGATAVSPARVPLGQVRAGERREAFFQIVVPPAGRRFLLQFAARGEGPRGPLARGATYNILPDGPDDPGRMVQGESGRRYHEFAARRIER